MSETFLKETSIKNLLYDIATNDKKITQQQCQYVWESFNRATVTSSQHNQSLLILDMFIISVNREFRANKYVLRPTVNLSNQLGLQQNNLPDINMIINFSKKKLRQGLQEGKHGLSIDSAWIILEIIFKKIKEELKNYDQIFLDFLGTIGISNGQFFHIFKEDSNVRIRKLKSSKRKSSLLKQSRLLSENFGPLKRESTQLSCLSINNKKSYFNENILKQVSYNKPEKIQKRWINNLIVPDTRIPDQLLGAGIDPLKYDYNYSKLVSNTSQLFGKTFFKPKPAKMRHPGIIDKFERTAGVPQTGLKVSNSVIVRIGSNYNTAAKRLYLDTKTRKIMWVPRQPKISFGGHKNENIVISANQIQEYEYLIGKNQSLQANVQARRRMYKRYTKYLNNYIQNDNICPMGHQTIRRILKQLRVSAPSHYQKTNQYFKIAQKAINQGNIVYFKANKKAILDYILKDQSQRERTGIDTIFNKIGEWGQNRKAPIQSVISKQEKEKVEKKLDGYLFFPKCITEITEINLKIREIDLFMLNNQVMKPVNVLYFIKKQKTQTNQVISYLGSQWIKNVVDVIKKHINVSSVNQNKLGTFIRLINVILSNTLKSIIQTSLEKFKIFFKRFSLLQKEQYIPILQVSITDQDAKFVLTDDFQKIITEQIRQIIKNLLQQTAKIHSIEFYLRDDPNSYINAMSDQDPTYNETIQEILMVIQQNCQLIQEFLLTLKPAQRILQFKDQMNEWMKHPHHIRQNREKIQCINEMLEQIEQIPHSYKKKIFSIECFDEKERLRNYLISIKIQLYKNLENVIQNRNFQNFSIIQEIKFKISATVENTREYTQVYNEMDKIKNKDMPILSKKISENSNTLISLLNMDYGYISADTLQKVYLTTKTLKSLPSKIQYHQQRLSKQKAKLQSKLNKDIKNFQEKTAKQFQTINLRIQQFQIRRIHNQYLMELNMFKQTVDENEATIIELNSQQEDLKWRKIQFKSAIQLKSLVIPSLDLWNLVLQYDSYIKQWKNQPISKLDVKTVKQKISKIYQHLSQLQLKNLSSMKVSSQLQSDCKQILNQQLQIIQIFSHPGLKQRHWQIFNTKLMIPGYDLKQITYSKIKLFYEYEKIIKILSIISKQAAREFQIQQQKKSQQDYWSQIVFRTYLRKQDNTFCISDHFLNKVSETLLQNQTKLKVMKNYLYSKTLYQQLSQWELWLANSHKLIQNLKRIQTNYLTIKGLFLYQNIAKQMPIQYSEFQAVQSAWKTISKKIFQYPKFIQFSKSAKIIEFTNETIKRLQTVQQGIPQFLKFKRNQFSRFYFIDDQTLTSIIAQSSYSITKDLAMSRAFSKCFVENIELVYNSDRILEFRSPIDSLIITCEAEKVRTKNNICETMNLVLNCMKLSLNSQIQNIYFLSVQDNAQILLKNYSLSAIFCCSNIQFTNKLRSCHKAQDLSLLLQKTNQKIDQIIQIIAEDQNIRLKAIKMLIGVLSERQILRKYQNIQGLIQQSFQFHSELKFYRKIQTRDLDQSVSSNSFQSLMSSRSVKSASRIKRITRKITAARRTGMKQNNESQYYIQNFYKRIVYGLQYWGAEADNFKVLFSNKFIINTFANMCNTTITHIPCQRASYAVYLLSNICGRFYKKIESNQINIENLIKGTLSSNNWIVFCMQQNEIFGKFSKLIYEVYQQIYQKISQMQQMQGKTVKKQIFINKLNEIIDIDRESCFFIYLPNSSYQKIPTTYRSRMRTVSYVCPNINLLKNLQKQSQFIPTSAAFRLINEVSKRSSYNKTQLDRIEQKLQQYRDQPKKSIELIQKYIESKEDQVVRQQLYALCEQVGLLKNNRSLQSIQEENTNNNHKVHSKISENILSKQKILLDDFLKNIQNSIQQQLKSGSLIIAGPLHSKQAIILQVIKKVPNYKNINEGLYCYPSSFFKQNQKMRLKGITQAIYKQYKTNLKRSIPQVLQIVLWVQYQIDQDQKIVQKVNRAIQQIQKEGIFIGEIHGYQKISVKVIFDCQNIAKMSPFTLINIPTMVIQLPENTSFGKYISNSVNRYLIQQKILDNFNTEVPLNETISFHLQSFQANYQQILSTVLKTRSAKIYHSIAYTKMVLTKNFINMIKLYFNQIRNKCYEDSCVDLDVPDYLTNSLLYCLYWTLCQGYLVDGDQYQIEEYLMKQHFQEIKQIESISKYFLNQDNQWLVWTSLKEQFSLNSTRNIPIYNIWVSTEQNMRIYMNIIKYLEFGLSTILYGGSCSGKSTILRQLNNFQISKDSLLISCNKKTEKQFINNLLKNQLYYKTNSQKLILIDDLHLPDEQKDIGQILTKMLSQKKLIFGGNTQNESICSKKIDFSSLILSYNQTKNCSQSLKLFRSNCQQINIRNISQNEISTIFKSYIKFTLQKNIIEQKMVEEYSDLLISYLCKINRKISVDLHQLKKVFKIFIQKLSYYQNQGDEHKQTKQLTKFSALNIMNFSIGFILPVQKYSTQIKLLMEQSNKITNGDYARDIKVLEENLQLILYQEIPYQLALQQKIDNHSKINILQNSIEQAILQKQNFYYVSISEMTKIVFKLIRILKAFPSHLLYLTEGSYGTRTVIRLLSFLCGISFIQIDTQNTESVINDCINIIKAGGKIDESVYYIGRKTVKYLQDKEVMTMVNCFISEPQLHSFFTESRIEQIFVKFTSQKKTLRRNQFIKKVKQKIDQLFHFAINLDSQQYSQITKIYPQLCKQCYKQIQTDFPKEACISYGRRILGKWRKQTLPQQSCLLEDRMIKTMCEIKNQFDKQIKQSQNGRKLSLFKQIGIIQYFRIVNSLYKRLDYINKSEETDSDSWEQRAQQTRQKYQCLLVEKQKLLNLNNKYFQQNNKFNSEIQKKQMKKKYIHDQIMSENKTKQQISDQLLNLKNQYKNKGLGTTYYQKMIDLQAELASLDDEQGLNHIYQCQVFAVLSKIMQNSSGLRQVDIRSQIIQVLEKCRVEDDHKFCQQFKQIVSGNIDNTFTSEDGIQKIFNQWLKQKQQLIQFQNNQITQINNKQQILMKINKKIEMLCQQIESIEKQINEVKQQFQNQFPDSQSTSQAYENIVEAISQTQSILNIFNHFHNVMKRHNSQNQKHQAKSTNKYLGNLIFACAQISYSFYLKDSQFEAFNEAVFSILAQNRFQVDQNKLFQCFLSRDDKFRFKYAVSQKHQSHIISHLIISLNLCSILTIQNPENFLSFHYFICQMSNKNKHFKIIQNNKQHLLPCYLATGQKIIILNPNQKLIKKLKPLIQNDGQFRDNNLYINLDEEVMINQDTRVVFVFTGSYSERIIQNYFDDIWRLKFMGYSHQQINCNFIKLAKKELCPYETPSQKLIQKYLELCQQLESTQKKISNLIINIRKNMENPDSIIVKIENVIEEKNKILTKMQDISEKIDSYDSGQVQDPLICQRQKYIKILTSSILNCQGSNPFNFLKFLSYIKSKKAFLSQDMYKQITFNLVNGYTKLFSQINEPQYQKQQNIIRKTFIDSKRSPFSEEIDYRKIIWRQLLQCYYADQKPVHSQTQENIHQVLVLKAEEVHYLQNFIKQQLIELSKNAQVIAIDNFKEMIISQTIKDKIFVTKIKSEEQWQSLMSFIRQQTTKNIPINIIIIVANHICIPHQIEVKSGILKNNNQHVDLLENQLDICSGQIRPLIEKSLSPKLWLIEQIKELQKKLKQRQINQQNFVKYLNDII